MKGTMSRYKELLQQREDLDKKLNEVREEELAGVISQIREMVIEWGLSAADIFPEYRVRGAFLGTKGGSRSGVKVAAKYCDPATGQTWSGRGKAPKWIEGQDREKFLIPNP